jgi:pimeloyl-ACP methyl ester carboxylesterase
MQVATMPMIAKTVRLGAGLTLEYVERGSRGKVPVVFLHGVTDSWGSFEGLLSRLPECTHAYALSHVATAIPAGRAGATASATWRTTSRCF